MGADFEEWGPPEVLPAPDDQELMREMRERDEERRGQEVDRLARLHDGRNRYQGGM